MTTTHPCGGDAVHAKFDQARSTAEALADEITAARRPAEKAGRGLTPAEQARVDRTRAAFDDSTAEVRKSRRELEDHHVSRGCSPATAAGSRPTSHDPDQREKTALMADLDAMLNRSAGLGGSGYSGAKRRDTRWSAKALEEMRGRSGMEPPSKSLAAPGVALVPTAFDGAPVRDGERPDSLRQLVPTVTLVGTDRYAFLRQVTRTNRAAPVRAGRVKPTSTYTLARVEDRCRVVAHLSEPVSRMDLDDSADLAAFLDAELRGGLLWAVEDQIINGTGVVPTDDADGEEDLLGVLATPGILAQEWAGDLFTTTRRALTVQQQLANTPSAWALNPSDWERFELAREDTATTGGFVLATGPVDRAQQRLWSLPVIATDVVPAGTAILGDWSGSARVYEREQARVEWSDAMYFAAAGSVPASSAFARNQLVMRAEQRTGFALTRPSAFAEVSLTP